MIKIQCTSCQSPLQIDETKLPMQPVTFPCPTCKTKLTVDRRELAGGGAAAPAAAAPPAAAPAPSHDYDEPHQLGEKLMIVGVDSPQLRAAAKSINLNPVFFAAADQARDYYLREYPSVVIVNPQQLTPPPLADLAPLISINPVDRRKGFFILIAENLRTFDGNAAFLYGMNLIIATRDLGSFTGIYREAEAFQTRLYHSMNAAIAAR